MTKCLQLIAGILLLVLISACNGSSGSNTGSNTTPSVTAISLTLTNDAQQPIVSYANNQSIIAHALVTDNFNQPVAGQIVSFSASLGTLVQATGLTNSDGVAEVSLTGDSLLGAGALTASIGNLSTSANYEWIQATVEPVKQNSLTVSLAVNGLADNRFDLSESATATALLLDSNGQPLANKIIQFSTELAQLNVTSALTDSNGMASVVLTGLDELGAAALLASFSDVDTTLSATVNYEITAAPVVPDEIIKLGHFNNNGEFIEGSLGTSLITEGGSVEISAGGTLGISLAMVDSSNQRIMSPTVVSFSSNCVLAGLATINASVQTINGVANATFEDISCAGNAGTPDTIVATVTVNNLAQSISLPFNIAAEAVGAIEFISASPESIVLQGTGGVNKQEVSVLTFKVTGRLGNALSNQQVNFSLNTTVGNLSLSPASAYTNSNGLVTTKVLAGNVPSVVRVTASTQGESGIIATQSDLLSVNTGLPDQNSITIAAETINVEDINGNSTQITAYMADAFNNPVPDGTTVNFTAEGGQIGSSCTTTDGRCSVTWTATEPRVDNHRITVLATAVGHETFYDTNGNNQFDNADGSAITNSNAVASGFNRSTPQSSGFVDMSEAWRDDDEDKAFDSGEVFIDFNNDNKFTTANGLFDGPQCTGSLCGNNTLNVRKSLVLIMSSSEAVFTLSSGGTQLFANSSGTQLTLAEGASADFTLSYSDSAVGTGQILAAGTTVSVASDVGELKGTTSVTVPNSIGTSNPQGKKDSLTFSLTNTNDPATVGDSDLVGFISVEFLSPSGVITRGVYKVVLDGI